MEESAGPKNVEMAEITGLVQESISLTGKVTKVVAYWEVNPRDDVSWIPFPSLFRKHYYLYESMGVIKMSGTERSWSPEWELIGIMDSSSDLRPRYSADDFEYVARRPVVVLGYTDGYEDIEITSGIARTAVGHEPEIDLFVSEAQAKECNELLKAVKRSMVRLSLPSGSENALESVKRYRITSYTIGDPPGNVLKYEISAKQLQKFVRGQEMFVRVKGDLSMLANSRVVSQKPSIDLISKLGRVRAEAGRTYYKWDAWSYIYAFFLSLIIIILGVMVSIGTAGTDRFSLFAWASGASAGIGIALTLATLITSSVLEGSNGDVRKLLKLILKNQQEIGSFDALLRIVGMTEMEAKMITLISQQSAKWMSPIGNCAFLGEKHGSIRVPAVTEEELNIAGKFYVKSNDSGVAILNVLAATVRPVTMYSMGAYATQEEYILDKPCEFLLERIGVPPLTLGISAGSKYHIESQFSKCKILYYRYLCHFLLLSYST